MNVSKRLANLSVLGAGVLHADVAVGRQAVVEVMSEPRSGTVPRAIDAADVCPLKGVVVARAEIFGVAKAKAFIDRVFAPIRRA